MKNRYGKILTLIIVLMLALMTLEACSSGSGDTEPVVTEEPPAEEKLVQEEPPAEKGAEQEETDIDAVYKTGQVYVLKDALRVREEPSTDSRQKKRSELTEYDLKKASDGNDAVLKAGAYVNCLEVNGDWMRIESGWICCREGDEVYITEPIELMPPEDGDWTYDKGYYYDEEGEKFFITETDEKLTGTYNISGISSDSIEFYSDGTCIYHTEPGSGMPHFDENGSCDGEYNYRNGKVYFRLGGTMNVIVYKIAEGELVQQ